MLEHLEAQYVFVPVHPGVHLAFFNIANRVVNKLESAWVLLVVFVQCKRSDGSETGHERGALLDLWQRVFAGAADEGVHGASVGLDARGGHGAMRIAHGDWLIGALAAVLHSGLPCCLCVKDVECNVLDAVAKLGKFCRGGVILGKWSLQEETNVPLRQEVLRGLATSGGQVADLLHLEPKRRRIEERGLLGVPDIEANVVDVNQVQRIGARGGAVRGLCGGGRHWGNDIPPGGITFGHAAHLT